MDLLIGTNHESHICIQCVDGYVEFDIRKDCGCVALDLSSEEAIEIGMRMIQAGEKAKKQLEEYGV